MDTFLRVPSPGSLFLKPKDDVVKRKSTYVENLNIRAKQLTILIFVYVMVSLPSMNTTSLSNHSFVRMCVSPAEDRTLISRKCQEMVTHRLTRLFFFPIITGRYMEHSDNW